MRKTKNWWTTMKLTINTYLRKSRRLFPLASESQELYRNILFNLNKAIKNFDNQLNIVGIYTPEYRNAIVPLDESYIVIDFSLMDLIIELKYIFENNDWERYQYLFYVLAQEPELEAGNIDKVLFYNTLADKLFDEEKERIIENSRNILHVLLSFYFITYHEFFHYQEKQYPHNAEYYAALREYIKSIEYNGIYSPDDIAAEVICDTEAIIQLLYSGVGLREGFVQKAELFEICLDTLVMLTVIQLLLKRISSANEITKRIWATFGWISMHMRQHEAFQGIDYQPIIEKAKQKISLFMEHTVRIAKEERKEKVQIPDLSEAECNELLAVFLKRRDGVNYKGIKPRTRKQTCLDLSSQSVHRICEPIPETDTEKGFILFLSLYYVGYGNVIVDEQAITTTGLQDKWYSGTSEFWNEKIKPKL